jgi:hypothetical protein
MVVVVASVLRDTKSTYRVGAGIFGGTAGRAPADVATASHKYTYGPPFALLRTGKLTLV